MSIKPANEIKVALKFEGDFIPVGRLALRDNEIYFEYSASFIEQGMELSPFRLPLRPGVQKFDRHLFDGLPGVFYDCLPDGWGRLLVDRALRSQSVDPRSISALDRLACVGQNGMGALTFLPEWNDQPADTGELSLDELSTQAEAVLTGDANDVLEGLIALNGSSAGARPKAVISVNKDKTVIRHGTMPHEHGFEAWLVKFANTQDGPDAGAIEFVYAQMAENAGIEMTDVHLFPAKNAAGYFATKRFDRIGPRRLHLHSACGLLHSDFRTPSLDYEDLITLTGSLTKDVREVEKMFRLAVFNVLAHNRDDHSKNFSFLMNASGEWKLAPAYDLTFSSGPGGEQSTMVMGEGKSPSEKHLRELGAASNIDAAKVALIIDQTKGALSNWEELAINHGVSLDNVNLIDKSLHK